jgi:hypothetical protein
LPLWREVAGKWQAQVWGMTAEPFAVNARLKG